MCIDYCFQLLCNNVRVKTGQRVLITILRLRIKRHLYTQVRHTILFNWYKRRSNTCDFEYLMKLENIMQLNKSVLNARD